MTKIAVLSPAGLIKVVMEVQLSALELRALLSRAPLSWALAVLVPPGQVWVSLAKQP